MIEENEVIYKSKVINVIADKIYYYKENIDFYGSLISYEKLLEVLKGLQDEIDSLPPLESFRVANGDEINNIWSIDDVHKVNDDHIEYFSSCPDENDWVKLTDQEARHILQKVESGFDAEMGINWSQIEFWVGQYHEGEIPL